ncbi:MAG TPA: gliding motility-associated C-terminal domain-containing protein, partial [Chitinophagales bacterium]|nr:gliding motility-associated C-terminal domain-containing protein [Chitinophagales bacterium]
FLDEVVFYNVNCNADNDGDGVPNSLDLDSDNDGIYDLVEAGHGMPDADNNGRIDGPNSAFGVNGYFSALETSDNIAGTGNYTVTNTDGAGAYDFLSLNSDADTCFDVIEAGYTTADADGLLGTTVDANGVVTGNGGYTTPQSNTANGYDFQNAGWNACECHIVYTTTVDTGICQGAVYTLPDNSTTATSGTYIDTLLTAEGCDSVITTNLTVHPVFNIAVDDTICQGDNYTLPDGTVVNATNTYTSTLQTVFGCDSVITTNLFVRPTTTTDVYDTICASVSYTLPSGNVVSNAGNHTDTLNSVHGCDSVVITHLFVTPPPVADVYDTICANQTYTLPSGNTVSAAGNYNDTLIAPTGCDSVVITHLFVRPNDATAIADTICNGTTYTLQDGTTVTMAGSYPVTLTNQYGCDSVVTTNLAVITVVVTSTPTDVLCNGDNTGRITATATGGVSQYNYDLLSGGTILSNNTTGNFTALAAGTYDIDVQDTYGCTATTTAIVNEPAQLIASDTVKHVRCYGEGNGQIAITANGGTPGYSFILNNQFTNTTGVFSLLQAGDYAYTVTDGNGCTDTSSATITEPQEVTISLTPDSAVLNLGQTMQLNATSNYDPAATYQWTPAIGLSCYDCPNPTVQTYNNMQYTVEVVATINGQNCTAETGLSVTVIPNYDIFIPNTFTPNGDGNNDLFQIFGNLPALKYVGVQIFNRAGEKVFDSNDLAFTWDGTYKGQPLPAGVYVYTLRVVFVDNHTEQIYKGSLTLMR